MFEELLLPWWKFPIYAFTIGLTAVCVRVAITFDVNTWLRNRQEEKQKKERLDIVRDCSHIWTLYRESTHSRCDSCGVLIATTLLLSAQQLAPRGNVPSPVFSGEVRRMVINVGEGDVLTDDYVGKR